MNLAVSCDKLQESDVTVAEGQGRTKCKVTTRDWSHTAYEANNKVSHPICDSIHFKCSSLLCRAVM